MIKFLFSLIFTFSQIVIADHTFDDWWDKDGNWKKDAIYSPFIKKGVDESNYPKTIYLTQTIDDLINYGYKKEDIDQMKNMAQCNSNKLSIIKRNKKDYEYELKYPTCWVLKQPFKNINQDENVWFMVKFSDHEHIQLFRISPRGVVFAVYPRIELIEVTKYYHTWFGAKNIFFINKCEHKWMNHSIAFEIKGGQHRWEAWEIQNLDSLLHFGYRYGDGTKIKISYRVSIPNSDFKGEKNTTFPWFSSNPKSNGYCEEIYRIVRKRVYYEK